MQSVILFMWNFLNKHRQNSIANLSQRLFYLIKLPNTYFFKREKSDLSSYKKSGPVAIWASSLYCLCTVLWEPELNLRKMASLRLNLLWIIDLQILKTGVKMNGSLSEWDQGKLWMRKWILKGTGFICWQVNKSPKVFHWTFLKNLFSFECVWQQCWSIFHRGS